MPKKGFKFSEEQRRRLSESHKGQSAWNEGTGGCKRGHDPSLYVPGPSGVYYCLECKRNNGKKYRDKNHEEIRIKSRVARYDITIDFFNELFLSQDKRCAICREPIELKKCRIDHDHETGRVRGLLCSACNTAVGLFKDSTDNLSRAIEYLLQGRND